jgi:hypothetical protein
MEGWDWNGDLCKKLARAGTQIRHGTRHSGRSDGTKLQRLKLIPNTYLKQDSNLSPLPRPSQNQTVIRIPSPQDIPSNFAAILLRPFSIPSRRQMYVH